MLETPWDSSIDPTGWWMSEKYDGVRLFWGWKNFYNQKGKIIRVPKSIVDRMPEEELDGELWCNYGGYENSYSLLSSINVDKWEKATYFVFDAPSFEGSFEVAEFI
jgi:DNA ligase-1